MHYKPDWTEARKRIEAWWSGEVIDRVAIAVTASRSQPAPERPWPPPADPERLWTDVEYRLDLTEAYCARTYFGGEAYPRLNPSMGPGTLALFLGAFPTWMDDTVWFDPVFRELSESTTLAFDARNQWWGVCQQLVAAGMEQGRDRYLVVLPDLIENLDTLASLRGTDALLVDAVLSKNSSARQSALTAFSRATDHCTRPQTMCDMGRPQNAQIVFLGGTGPARRQAIDPVAMSKARNLLYVTRLSSCSAYAPRRVRVASRDTA
ncbi:MAG: hypothetical protein A2Y74_03805 [Actinobacteria bacterium RBG_13_63_9]|nr:MAG: hypothetical protein A2Y74_03805 [Actinobacteria bacterium RBG_13_63_9]